ncbi:deoxyribose-phosphate aldolase [Mycoplasmopsis agassizii]|uniref:Deoxyribose-phosphate aldolase n=1 Tax=Mycoplasmopsis agassizii TaxID=33922 RepID=A0A269TJN8_9BACT|nr:deoxyribose-phosphate aldolase [Mycoplasmopsis agassizii]PAK21689.1 deoxyribose-phosphate aldolase [Mycoplasmopsis agassizii]
MQINKLIDHTLLKAEARSKDIDKLIQEALKYDFKTICVNSSWVKYAHDKLKKSNVGITAVVGFPLGAMISQAKAQEAKLAIEHGASEIDMVINVGRFKDHDYEYVLNDIKAVKNAIGKNILKVIVETALLTDIEIKEVTEIVLKSGADFIKTSTGFSYRGATVKDVEIMNNVVKDAIGIKAAGGVKNLNDLKAMIEAGATRIGTSSGVALMENKEADKKSY